ncbi:hypothetical protein ACSQ67_002992 [Phaseolus vulgaris]
MPKGASKFFSMLVQFKQPSLCTGHCVLWILVGFCTVMDFCWVDEYDVIAGSNWNSRPVVRRKARREDNDTMRRLGYFVKKRDKRVYRSVEM